MFTRPLKIPYLTKENAPSIHDNLNSFAIRDPLYVGHDPTSAKAESGGIHYTIGSLDKQKYEAALKLSAQKEKDK